MYNRNLPKRENTQGRNQVCIQRCHICRAGDNILAIHQEDGERTKEGCIT